MILWNYLYCCNTVFVFACVSMQILYTISIFAYAVYILYTIFACMHATYYNTFGVNCNTHLDIRTLHELAENTKLK